MYLATLVILCFEFRLEPIYMPNNYYGLLKFEKLHNPRELLNAHGSLRIKLYVIRRLSILFVSIQNKAKQEGQMFCSKSS